MGKKQLLLEKMVHATVWLLTVSKSLQDFCTYDNNELVSREAPNTTVGKRFSAVVTNIEDEIQGVRSSIIVDDVGKLS